MKSTINFILLIVGLGCFVASCDKATDLPYHNLGNPVQLSASTTTVAPQLSDSNKTVLTLNWSFPNYATDSTNMKYIVEMDSTGRNFARETTKTVTKSLSTSFLAKELNNMLLAYGYAFNVPVTMDVRVTSSYANNNEKYVSNVVKIKMTPYHVPPKVVPPSSNELFLVGGTTAGGWDNPVPVPAQQFKRLDSVTYQGTFYFKGGGAYDLLPVDGSWNEKYNVADNSLPNLSAGGDFQHSTGPGNDIPAPAKQGMYTVTFDFQHGKFTVTPAKLFGLLWVPGDYQGWDPGSAPTLASVNNDGNYEGYVNVPAGGTYEFKLTSEPDWNGTNYGDGGGGMLSTSGGNLKFPSAGYYKINANTTANTWSVTATTWSLIGSFAPSNWGSDVDMTYDAGSNKWTGTITTVAGDQFKFRANHDWGLNYGETAGTGSLSLNGDNIGDPAKNSAITPGTHTITLYLGGSGFYTYTIN